MPTQAFLLLILNLFIRFINSNPSRPQTHLPEWSGWGASYLNNRWSSSSSISSSNILSAKTQCNISYPIGVSATPSISGSVVYYPTWSGLLVALDFHSCQTLWQINVTSIISKHAPISTFQREQVKPVSRTSPQIDAEKGIVYFGTQTHALIMAVSAEKGELMGVAQVNDHELAVITMSPTLFEGKLYVGAASVEESVSLLPSYKCCSFVGNFVALRFERGTFEVLWNVSMIPPVEAAMGWSGVGLWGSQPSIDTNLRQVFFATGNTYSVPDVIIQCQKDTANISAVTQGLVTDSCLPDSIWQESIISVDIDLGLVNWVHQLPTLDAFTAACGFPGFSSQNSTLCPEVPGLDTDFGMAPTFVPGSSSTPYGKDTIVVGQKSGILYAMSAQAGQLFWSTITSPDGLGGGLSWGIAVDDSRVYFTAINSGEIEFQLQPSDQGKSTNRSAYGAASLKTGALLWEAATPRNGVAYGPPSVVGDLVLVARTGSDPNGTANYDQTAGGLVALRKDTGEVLLDFELSTNFHGGMAIQDRSILFGTGYSGFGPLALVPGAFNVLQV